MRTDQLLSRLWFSVKWLGLRLKFLAANLIALAGTGLALAGAYIMIRPNQTIAARSTLIDSLPAVQGFTTVDGGLMLAAGGVIVLFTTQT